MVTTSTENTTLSFFRTHFKGIDKIGPRLKPATTKKASQTCMCMHQPLCTESAITAQESSD